jgi:hypothetical protein
MRYAALLLVLATVGCSNKSSTPINYSDPVRVDLPSRYFVTVFAYEGQVNLARNSHSFATFSRAQGYNLQSHTISWYPRNNDVRLAQASGQSGKNMTLNETIEHARKNNAKIYYFGSYEITEELYQKALTQVSYLESGAVKYHALGNGMEVCNCIHAVSNVLGPLKTYTAWGVEASRMIVGHFRPHIIRPHVAHPQLTEQLLSEVGLQGISPAR